MIVCDVVETWSEVAKKTTIKVSKNKPCPTQDPKMVRMCLGVMQKLIVNKVLDFEGASLITDRLWMLMESGIEEVKIVQTLTLLLTSSHVVQNETLAKCLVICFRLNFTKDNTVNTIAGWKKIFKKSEQFSILD